jgi:hypothetical protein
MGTVSETAAERLAGRRPSRVRSALAAAAVGGAAAVMTYRLLRTKEDENG